MNSGVGAVPGQPSARPSWIAALAGSRASFYFLAASLFMAALPSLRVTGVISWCDLLFVCAVLCGGVERVLLRELSLDRRVMNVLAWYALAAVLMVASLFANILDPNRATGATAIAIESLNGYRLTQSASQLFGGEYPQWPRFSIFFFCAVMMPVMILCIRIKDAFAFKVLLGMWTAGALYGAAFTFAYCHGWIQWVDPSWSTLRRARGLTAHANILGLYTALACPGILYLFFSTQSRAWRFAALVALYLCWEVANLSGSRAAAGGVLMLVTIYLVLHQRGLIAQFRAALIVTLLILAMSVFQPLFSAWIDGDSRSAIGRLISGGRASDVVRDLINTMAWEQAWGDPLFGVGYQMLRVAHNIFLQLFHASGLVGLSGYLVVLILPLLVLWTTIRRDERERELSVAFMSALGALLPLSFVKSNPSEFSVALLVALGLYWGMAARLTNGSFAVLRRSELN